MKVNVELKIPVFVTLEVEADNIDQAVEKAIEHVELEGTEHLPPELTKDLIIEATYACPIN